MPQFDILSDPAAIGLNLAWFVVLFALTMFIVNMGIKRIIAVREKREVLTSGNVEKAEALLDEAKQLMNAYEDKMAAARSEAQGIIKEASDAAAAKAAAAQSKLADELTAKRVEIETAIANQTEAALAELSTVASDTASAAATQILGVKVDGDKLSAAVKEISHA